MLMKVLSQGLVSLTLLLAPAVRAALPVPGGMTPGAVQFVLEQQLAAPLAPTEPNRLHYGAPWLRVGVRTQTAVLFDEWGRETRRYVVSTARNGVGEKVNSYQTPRGWHQICEKIGDGVEPDTIIYRRRITEWKYTPELHAQYPDKDWILTRILWLCGQEPGRNQGGDVDSYDRAIYLHGAGSHVPFGTPTSRGCVRMRNDDIIELYELAQLGLDVYIDEQQ
ncbi:L,D-transpeptidase catalytic domain [Gulbenkiania indica]|uniref:L,D-transpeptidase catalytic domain n=2 Tax=Gulbenkiania TaxID=397456 RepID=A0A0K6GRU6_9NEIS|nr:L,D-transpeptidase [Gulbenkiania indica]TCW32210.1 L,D-transpeptidase-like protein [Gulbenkiania mobilis]CUA81479.1 L,D-transpeptidase catalytic domain [Gulbenkiania indica]